MCVSIVVNNAVHTSQYRINREKKDKRGARFALPLGIGYLLGSD
jgi:hypothetical protein